VCVYREVFKNSQNTQHVILVHTHTHTHTYTTYHSSQHSTPILEYSDSGLSAYTALQWWKSTPKLSFWALNLWVCVCAIYTWCVCEVCVCDCEYVILYLRYMIRSDTNDTHTRIHTCMAQNLAYRFKFTHNQPTYSHTLSHSHPHL
jgi:hypothetical protein